MALTDYDRKIDLSPTNTTDSGATVDTVHTVYLDPTAAESKTGTGTIGYDSSIVADAQDIGFYDSAGNLMPYEIENPSDVGSSSAVVVVHIYGSLVRDGSAQIQFAYGNNSANADRSVDGTGTSPYSALDWRMIQHLDASPIDAVDETANNNDGTVSSVTSVTGQFYNAGSFDSTNPSTISIPDSTSLTLDEAMTVSAWFKTTTTTGDYIISKQQDSAGDNFEGFIIFLDGSGHIQGNLRGDSGSTGAITSSATVNDGNWHKVDWVWNGATDATAEIELFLDGSSVGTISASVGTVAHTAPFGIGARVKDNTNPFTGDIDEVQVKGGQKSTQVIQAEYEQSSAAGNTFFSQSTATTTSTETVTTNSSSNVRASSADLTGEVTDLGGNASVEAGFQYRETGASTWNETTKETISATGTYTQTVTGLLQNTEYEFRAEIEDGGGTQLDTGSTLTFTTLDALAAISPADQFETASRSIDFQYSVDKENSGTVELVVDGNVEATHTTPVNTTFTDTVSGLDRDGTSKNWNVDFYLDGSSTPDDSTTARSFTVRTFDKAADTPTFKVSTTATTWGTSLSQTEVYREPLDAGEALEVEEVNVSQIGGGNANSNFQLEVYDVSQATVLATCDLNEKIEPNVTSNEGTTILLRVTNSTGSTVDASFKVDGNIV